MRLAHAAAASTSCRRRDEIAAIDRFRATLLAAIDAAGVGPPGRPATVGPERAAALRPGRATAERAIRRPGRSRSCSPSSTPWSASTR